MSAIPLTIEALQTLPVVVAAAGTRIYPVQAPQGAPLPHVVVTVGSEAEDYTLGGATDTAAMTGAAKGGKLKGLAEYLPPERLNFED
jgi:hypothetical protein